MMRKKISIFSAVMLSFIMLINTSVPVLASCVNEDVESTLIMQEKKCDKTIKYIEGDLQRPETYEAQVSELLSNPDVDEVIVIDPNYKEFETADIIEDMSNSDTMATTIYRYRISNVQSASDWTGSTVIATAKGTPGTTLSISQTESISNTYSTSVSVDLTSEISSAVGFSVTSSTSITISGSDTVPSTHDGKQVSTMSLNARTIYKKVTFSIDRHKSVGGLNYGWTNGWGSGSASKPYGVSFSKTYTYK